MSDEIPPSPLRLRPRSRSESETPPAAAEVEGGKLRLKPKLAPDPESEPHAETEAEPVEMETPAEPVRLRPKLSLQPEPEPEPELEPQAQAEPEPEAVLEEAGAEPSPETEPAPEAQPEAEPEILAEEEPPPLEEVRVKLKIKPSGAVTQEGAAEETVEGEPTLPPFPVVAPPPEEIGALQEPPVTVEESGSPFRKTPIGPPPAGGRPAVFKRPRVPAALLAAERRKRVWKYALIAIVGVLLAGAVIGGAFLKFTPVPPPTVVPVRPKFVAPAEPVVVAPIQKVAPPPPLPTESSGERVESTATVELAPGVTATTESIKAVTNATPAFRTFVANAKISGVYQGTPSRAFINGRLVRVGDMVDEMMEIHFDSVDVTTRSIIFKDSAGATVSRRY